MGLRIGALGQRIMCSDEATGELLCDSEQLNTALQAEQQAHLKTLEAYQAAEAEIAVAGVVGEKIIEEYTMALQTKRLISPEEYLVIERSAQYKSEYLHGEMFAMAGASREHNLIVTNSVAELRQQLKKRPCRIYANDMRVKVSPTGLFTYPDIIVVCGQDRFDDSHKDTLLNPTVIIEVLSDSTEGYDRGKKFEHYRKLESLQEYVLIAQDKVHVERHLRQPDNQWLLTETDDLQSNIRLTSIQCELALAEIYDQVEIELA